MDTIKHEHVPIREPPQPENFHTLVLGAARQGVRSVQNELTVGRALRELHPSITEDGLGLGQQLTRALLCVTTGHKVVHVQGRLELADSARVGIASQMVPDSRSQEERRACSTKNHSLEPHRAPLAIHVPQKS